MSGSVPLPLLIAVSAAAVAGVSFVAVGLMRQYRLRRHLRRLRNLPLEQFGR